jgi:hypothetical protein
MTMPMPELYQPFMTIPMAMFLPDKLYSGQPCPTLKIESSWEDTHSSNCVIGKKRTTLAVFTLSA